MGNTGSGKSSSVSYFTGATMEEFISHVGDKVVRIAKQNPSNQEPKKYPVIGQSLGESETIYTSAYVVEP